MFKLKMPTIKKCDNCGKINPKCLYDSERLCGECAIEGGGFYRRKEWKFGTNGKIGTYKLRFPILINWIGFWGR